jgi:hypothetical protein
MSPIRTLLVVLVLAVPFAAPAEGKKPPKEEIAASSMLNPPPSEPLGAFARFELAPLSIDEAYAGHDANQKAKGVLHGHLITGVGAWVDARNAQAPAAGRTLVIEPRIDAIRFVSGGARMWGGALAGSSRVLLKLRLVDKQTGAVIAEPEFYQHARGMAGAWSGGGADYGMLERVAQLASDYVAANADAAVGGPTGKPE